jgi:hypothetical protein
MGNAISDVVQLGSSDAALLSIGSPLFHDGRIEDFDIFDERRVKLK